jgi:hypothetical protein
MQQTAALIALLAIASVMVNAGDFVQLLCTGASCNSGCSYQTFPEHRCLSMAEGQSGIASCDTTRGVLMVKNFYLSPNCSGASETTQQTLGQCYPTVAGSFVEYLCESPSDKKHDLKRKHDDAPPPPPPPRNGREDRKPGRHDEGHAAHAPRKAARCGTHTAHRGQRHSVCGAAAALSRGQQQRKCMDEPTISWHACMPVPLLDVRIRSYPIMPARCYRFARACRCLQLTKEEKRNGRST